MPKLEKASVREAADASSSTAFMPQPCCTAGVAVKDAMLMAVSQNELNATKSMTLVGLLARVIQVCKEASLIDDSNANVNNVIVGNGMLGKFGKCSSPEQAHNKVFKPL